MYEETRRKALQKRITDAQTPRQVLEIARARLFQLQEQVEAEAVDASDMSEYNGLMAESNGVERAWLLLDELLDDLK
jgi:hypothetical protein